MISRPTMGYAKVDGGFESAAHPTPSGCHYEKKTYREKGKKREKQILVCPQEEKKCTTRFGGEMVECE